MVCLRVSPQQALQLLKTIPHETCIKAISLNWEVDPNGHVHYHSVCWLFCWATTGMGSTTALNRSREVFNQILDVTYDQFNAGWDGNGYKHSQDARQYKGGNEQHAESEFERRLGHVPPHDDPLKQFKTTSTQALLEFQESVSQALNKLVDCVKNALKELKSD